MLSLVAVTLHRSDWWVAPGMDCIENRGCCVWGLLFWETQFQFDLDVVGMVGCHPWRDVEDRCAWELRYTQINTSFKIQMQLFQPATIFESLVQKSGDHLRCLKPWGKCRRFSKPQVMQLDFWIQNRFLDESFSIHSYQPLKLTFVVGWFQIRPNPGRWIRSRCELWWNETFCAKINRGTYLKLLK